MEYAAALTIETLPVPGNHGGHHVMNHLTIPRGEILSNEEVKTALARLMTPEKRSLGHGRVSQLFALCGVSYEFITEIRRGKRQAPEGLRAALTYYLPMLERGELKFHRTST